METYPGKDDLVRVVEVRTTTGEFVRAIHHLCLLEGIDVKTNSKDPALLVSVEDGTMKTDRRGIAYARGPERSTLYIRSFRKFVHFSRVK